MAIPITFLGVDELVKQWPSWVVVTGIIVGLAYTAKVTWDRHRKNALLAQEAEEKRQRDEIDRIKNDYEDIIRRWEAIDKQREVEIAVANNARAKAELRVAEQDKEILELKAEVKDCRERTIESDNRALRLYGEVDDLRKETARNRERAQELEEKLFARDNPVKGRNRG